MYLTLTDVRFSASDGKEGVAATDVTVNLCNCSGHGECLFDLLADGYELKQTFRIVQCKCSIGWEGKTHEFHILQTLVNQKHTDSECCACGNNVKGSCNVVYLSDCILFSSNVCSSKHT